MEKVTVYTDGGARDVNGEYHAGWSYFGYGDKLNPDVIQKEVDPTDTMDIDLRTRIIASKLDSTFQGYGGIGQDGTNNQGELMAVYKAMQAAVRKRLKYVDFYIDSKYTQEGINKNMHAQQKRGWRLSNNEVVKNLEMWQDMLTLWKECKREGFVFTFNWVKGHSGVFGNEMADALATMGCHISRRYESEEIDDKINYVAPKFFIGEIRIDEELKLEFTCIDVIGDEPVWDQGKKITKVRKAKAPATDPLITGRRVLLLTNKPTFTRPDCERSVVYSTSYVNDARVAERNLGVESADTHTCVTLTKERDFQLEQVLTSINGYVKDGDITPITVQWDKLTTSKTRQGFFDGEHAIENDGDVFFYSQTVTDKFGEEIISRIPVSLLRRVPRQAIRCLQYMDFKYELLDRYLKDGFADEDVLDITSFFLEDDGKKQKILTDIKTLPCVTVMASDEHEWANGIPVTANVDVPAFSKFQSIIKYHGNISIKMIRHSTIKGCYRYSFIVEADKAVSIMDNPYSNVVFTK